jgi:thermostable 8-oxoguanine DNA glycosylase
MGSPVAEISSMPATMDGQLVALEIAGETVHFDWGLPHELGTAAFWVEQTRRRHPTGSHRFGRTLEEEVVACLLGGHGMRAGLGIAAFERLQKRGLISITKPPSVEELRAELAVPLTLADGSLVRYRFPNQRAHRIGVALQILAAEHPPPGGFELRDWLLKIPGIGPKTASWITRNWSASEGIAIIDVHVHRVGVAAGFFAPHWRLPSHYEQFEEAFCAVARIGRVSTAALDARIWRDMAYLGSARRLMLG